MSENLWLEALMLLCLGMGFVLAFLCILIASMRGMSAVVLYLNKLFPEQVEVVEKKSTSKSAASDDAAIAVALAAVMAKK